MSRICFINIQREQISKRFISVSREVLEQVKRNDTEIAIKSPIRGPGTHSQMANLYGLFLISGEIIERILEAEKEEFDAVVVNGTLDMYLGIRQARCVVNIPVISPIEAAMLFSCLLGRKFGLVALDAAYLRPFMGSIISYLGLESRAIANAVRFISISHHDLMTKAIDEPALINPEFAEAVADAVADGAETIIPVGTNLGVICSLAGISSVDVNGVPVPVLNPLVIALKTAEMMCDLTAIGLPPISRAGLYRGIGDADLDELRKHFGLNA
jgi:Asp/Glu/hydantoin racemase